MQWMLRLLAVSVLLSGCIPANLPNLPRSTPETTATPPPAPAASPIPPVETAAGAPPTREALIFLADDFTGDLADQWHAWGQPAPVVRRGAAGPYLELSAFEPRYAAGLTSQAEIPFLPHVTVRFRGQLPPQWRDADPWLALDWDPRPGVKAQRDFEGAIIRVLLLRDGVVLYTRETDLECFARLDGVAPHDFRLVVEDEIMEAALWIDDAAEPACRHAYTDRIYEIARTGPLTLTGAGWVTAIEVRQ